MTLLPPPETLSSIPNQEDALGPWLPPQPLPTVTQMLPPVERLLPEALPAAYRPWLLDVAERMQCPLDYVAVAAVIVTASVIGAGCGIRPKAHDSWTVVPNLWGAIVGAPGSLKSPALQEIMKPLEVLEAEAREAYRQKHNAFMMEMDIHRATKEAFQKRLAKAALDGDSLMQDGLRKKLSHFPEPDMPPCKRYRANDVTVPKLHELLSQNPRGLLLFRDELMGLLESWDQKGHEGDRTFFLEAWNGSGTHTTDRILRGTVHAPVLCLSILGGTQPSKLLSYFGRALEGQDNDGLLQRFQLLVYPDELPHWTLVDRPPNKGAASQAETLLRTLAGMDFTAFGGVKAAEGCVTTFQFDKEAQARFYAWLQTLEQRRQENVGIPLLTESLAKQRKLVPALALIFHLIAVAAGDASGPVSLEALTQSLAWARYLESHAQRTRAMPNGKAPQGVYHLAQKIQQGALTSPFELRDLYRKGWSHLKTPGDADAACRLLVALGWLKAHTSRNTGRCAYDISPFLLRSFDVFR